MGQVARVFNDEDEFSNINDGNKRKRRNRKQRPNNSLSLSYIHPMTATQKQVFDYYQEGFNLLLLGTAGTGKTFISMYLALEELLDNPSIRDITIIRSAVPSRDIGFLPGSKKEKEMVFTAPYRTICNELFGRGDAYDILEQQERLKFITTSHVRGITLKDTIAVVDEIQNFNAMELHSIITRMGDNSRLVICGDTNQDDLSSGGRERSGLNKFIPIAAKMPSIRSVSFQVEDVVRSGLCKEYILACQN